MKMKDEWVAEGGSIYSTKVKLKCSKDFRLGKNYNYRDAIAFNVGQSVAEHIVRLHNESLKK
jgi:hypothetical protein